MSSEVHEVQGRPTVVVMAYSPYLLGDSKKNAPFYWKEWNDGKKKVGRLQHDLIIKTFAYHLNELQAVAPTERTLDYPCGALTLSVLAVQHVLTHYASGVWSPHEGRLGWFSEDNYGDTTQFKDGRNILDKRLGRVLQVAEDLSSEEWTDVYKAAWVVVQQRQQRGRRGKHGRVHTDVPAALTEDSDDDLMLIADA
ncbi:hypothetical protein BD414DRAFT_527134 [Trametes punicea]|nr:hypothetical protein BD414DRAFT_527134 [Trametes punicea]